MKNRINVFFFLWAIVTLLFFSCVKEELNPVPTTNRGSPRAAISNFSQTYEFVADTLQRQLFELNTLAAALENIDFNEDSDLSVAINSYSCSGRAKTLVVYNPYDQDIDFYDSCKFLVLWFKDDKPVRGTYFLDCVCKGGYAAIVINRVTNQGVGIAFHTILRACYSDEGSKIINAK